MKINWFSPLPPEKTGIADYTAVLLPALVKNAEVTLWTDKQIWSKDLERYANIRHYDFHQLPFSDFNRADINIFNMGNNFLYHEGIWDLYQVLPGIVILHDLCLQHFFSALYWQRGQDRQGYVELLSTYYGSTGNKDANEYYDGLRTIDYMAQRYPLTEYAISCALGAVVHTLDAFQQLSSMSVLPVLYSPLPYSIPEIVKTKTNRGTYPQKLNIIFFGFIGSNRRFESVLHAISSFPQKDRVHLDIYGKLWDDNLAGSLIKQLRLEKYITLHGYVSDEELNKGLASADLAINLRYPTMGEASLSQLQIWAHGLPSLVTPIGWYASIPPEAVCFVRHDHEIEDINFHLSSLLDNPGIFREMGIKGNNILKEKHSPEMYAKNIVHFVSDINKHPNRMLLNNLIDRVALELRILPTSSHDSILPSVGYKIKELL